MRIVTCIAPRTVLNLSDIFFVSTKSNIYKMSIRSPPEVLLRNAIRGYSSTKANLTASGGTYKSAVCTELGKPLEILTQTARALEKNELRIAVDRAAINFSDILLVQGKYQVKPPVPFAPGAELAGRILEVGSEVTGFKVGDHVVGGLGPECGGFSEQVVTSHAKSLRRVPADLPPAEGASFIVSYGTAHMALERHARIQPGEVVLVTAAAGALGLAAVDLAKNVFSAKVIGACGGADKCKLVVQCGAEAAIDYNKENLRDRIKELTGGRGVDIVFDCVGGKVLEDCIKGIAFEGRVLTLGYTSGDIPKIPANHLLVKNFSVHGVYWGSYGDRAPKVFEESVSSVARLWEQRKIKPYVGKVFPLAQINDAFEYISSRKSVGKVVLDCTKST